MQACDKIKHDTKNDCGDKSYGKVDDGESESLDEGMIQCSFLMAKDDRTLSEESRDLRHTRERREQKSTVQRKKGTRRLDTIVKG